MPVFDLTKPYWDKGAQETLMLNDLLWYGYCDLGFDFYEGMAMLFYNGFLLEDAEGAAFTGFAAVFQALVIILCLTAGTALIMWLGEQINEFGVGNGISMILFAGILSRVPMTMQTMFAYIGIYGTIAEIKEDTITLAVGAQKTSMVFARWAIRSVEDAPLENDNALV
mgnify:CR=1 FL=1